MKHGPGTRVALAAITLLAQLVLPVAHGLAPDASIGSQETTVAAATSAASLAPAHDPNLCPTCLALCQARTGIDHASPSLSGLVASSASSPLGPEVVFPGSPERALAAPRAPPISALSFA